MQRYDYLIAVDFEATCWECQPAPRWRQCEIIEFPAVLMNLTNGQIVAEFHEYIKPIEKPILSNYCINLTGITQTQANNGIPLQTALILFDEWLRKELNGRNLQLPQMSNASKFGNVAFVTWSDCDFDIFLKKECQRKHLNRAAYFNHWIDLRSTYINWYKYMPSNFNDALRHIGLTFKGREHSGIDDAKNIAALAYKMTCSGARLALTT